VYLCQEELVRHHIVACQRLVTLEDLEVVARLSLAQGERLFELAFEPTHNFTVFKICLLLNWQLRVMLCFYEIQV
jgi:hypothetical protein